MFIKGVWKSFIMNNQYDLSESLWSGMPEGHIHHGFFFCLIIWWDNSVAGPLQPNTNTYLFIHHTECVRWCYKREREAGGKKNKLVSRGQEEGINIHFVVFYYYYMVYNNVVLKFLFHWHKCVLQHCIKVHLQVHLRLSNISIQTIDWSIKVI